MCLFVLLRTACCARASVFEHCVVLSLFYYKKLLLQITCTMLGWLKNLRVLSLPVLQCSSIDAVTTGTIAPRTMKLLSLSFRVQCFVNGTWCKLFVLH